MQTQRAIWEGKLLAMSVGEIFLVEAEKKGRAGRYMTDLHGKISYKKRWSIRKDGMGAFICKREW